MKTPNRQNEIRLPFLTSRLHVYEVTLLVCSWIEPKVISAWDFKIVLTTYLFECLDSGDACEFNCANCSFSHSQSKLRKSEDISKECQKFIRETKIKNKKLVTILMIILHFYLQPQFKYELFHVYVTSFVLYCIISLLTGDMNSINWPRSQFLASWLSW